MKNFPDAIGELAAREYRPFCVAVDSQWQVSRIWGDADYFGYQNLTQGADVREVVPALVGFEFDVGEEEHCWPFLVTPAERAAHCYVLNQMDQIWVVWFAAEREHQEKRKIQQVANDVRIMSYRRNQLVTQLQVAKKEVALREQEQKIASHEQTDYVLRQAQNYEVPLMSIVDAAERLKGLELEEPAAQDLVAIAGDAASLLKRTRRLIRKHGG